MQKFKSRYSPGKDVTIAQYITELICEKKASISGKDLPIFFWKLPEWQKFYKSQIHTAYGLVRNYDSNVLIKVLNSPEAKRQFSLRSPKLLSLFKKAQADINRIKEISENRTEQENTSEITTATVIESPRSPQASKNNVLNKLRRI